MTAGGDGTITIGMVDDLLQSGGVVLSGWRGSRTHSPPRRVLPTRSAPAVDDPRVGLLKTLCHLWVGRADYDQPSPSIFHQYASPHLIMDLAQVLISSIRLTTVPELSTKMDRNT
jgi:hypothetical protein